MEPVLRLKNAETYPDLDLGWFCVRVYEYGKPYHDLRSFGIHVLPIGETESDLSKAYACTLRNIVRLCRFRDAAFSGSRSLESARLGGNPLAKRIHTIHESLLARGRQLQSSLPTLAGYPGLIDPFTPLPLYAPAEYLPEDFVFDQNRSLLAIKPHRRRLELQVGPSQMSGTVFEPRRHFLYREVLWSAAQEDSIEQCIESIDRALRPKETHRLVVRKSIPEAVRVFVWRRDEGKCTRCASRKNLEFDHIIPLVEGGSDTSRNIELLCEACNRSKGSRIR